jgi:anti-anti-sigma factor
MAYLEITEHVADGNVHVFSLSGDVDFDVAPELKRRITIRIDAGDRNLVVDLSAAGFVDSTAIGVIVGALKRLNMLGGSLAVVCDNDAVRGIFQIVGLENVIPLHHSEEHALAGFAPTA